MADAPQTTPTKAEILAQLEADGKLRAAACQAAIGAALQQFGCQLVPEVIISGTQVMSRVSIIPQ